DVSGEDAVQSPGPQSQLRIVGLLLQPFGLLTPGRAAEVGRLAADDAADVAGTRALDGLPVERIGPGLEVDQEAPPHLRGLAPALLYQAAAGHVYRDRLGEVHVLSRLHRVFGLPGMEVGRALDHDRVDVALQHATIAQETGVPPLPPDLEPAAELVEAILEVVGGGRDLIAPVLLEEIGEPGPPA